MFFFKIGAQFFDGFGLRLDVQRSPLQQATKFCAFVLLPVGL